MTLHFEARHRHSLLFAVDRRVMIAVVEGVSLSVFSAPAQEST